MMGGLSNKLVMAVLGGAVLAALAVTSPLLACGNRVGQGQGHRHGGTGRIPDWHDAHPGEWRGWNAWPSVSVEQPPDDSPPSSYGPPPSPYGPPPSTMAPGPAPVGGSVQQLRDERARLYQEIDALKIQRMQARKQWDGAAARVQSIQAQIDYDRERVAEIGRQLAH